IVRQRRTPVLAAGASGCFDEYGVNPVSILRFGSDLLLYYVGYQRSADNPYTLFTGLAVSTDEGENFVRVSEAPVLGPIPGERLFRTAANVHQGEGVWRMWYTGGDRWIEYEGKKLPLYGLRYVTSSDGVTWSLPTSLLEPDQERGQIGFGRPY